MIMQEKEFINFEKVQNAVRGYYISGYSNYQSEFMKKVINFIIPLSGRYTLIFLVLIFRNSKNL